MSLETNNVNKTELTGYPSIDKLWLKHYTKDASNAEIPNGSIYERLCECKKSNVESII